MALRPRPTPLPTSTLVAFPGPFAHARWTIEHELAVQQLAARHRGRSLLDVFTATFGPAHAGMPPGITAASFGGPHAAWQVPSTGTPLWASVDGAMIRWFWDPSGDVDLALAAMRAAYRVLAQQPIPELPVAGRGARFGTYFHEPFARVARAR